MFAGVATAVALAVSLFEEAVALAVESAEAVALALESAEVVAFALESAEVSTGASAVAVALSSFKFNLVLLFTYTRVAFLEALEVV